MGAEATKNLVIVGVGGQGALLASKILGNLALSLGLAVKVSEVHGMSQRGGSVTTYVRFGSQVHAPIVEQGGADFVLAFEQLEALRALPSLKDTGTMIVNEQKILPLPVIIGAAQYPEDIVSTLRSKAKSVVAVDALAMAEGAGNARALNIVLIGILASLLPYDRELWKQSIAAVVPKRLLDVNLAAFEAGYAVTAQPDTGKRK